MTARLSLTRVFFHAPPPLLYLTALLRTSAHKDAEALYALSDFIPNLPQDLKATLSDKQSLVRTLQHPKRRAFFLGAISIVCCLFNCVGKAKKIFC